MRHIGPGCDNSRKDPDCWEEVPGRFVSDMDVYMEFDDRWAHRGNVVNTNNEYETTGYPTGLRVMATAHSYGVSYAEDIMFVTVNVRNESGDWCAEDEYGVPVLDDDGNQICGEGMIMPDGTKLNRGKGFDYKDMSLGFYMDADVLVGDKGGYNSGLHTNDDDYMKYYYEFFELNDERLSVSLAMIGDYDGLSGLPGYAMDPDTPSPGNSYGVVATQMLESMVNHARPTRAEVTDVATAIRQHVSAVMLSGETAGGQHPVKAVETMARIAETVERSTKGLPDPPALAAFVSTRVIAGAAVEIARETNAKHLIVGTEHGNAARLMAAHRPRIPIYAMTNRIRAARRTTILPGVESLIVEEHSRARSTVAEAVKQLYDMKKIRPNDTIVAISGSPLAISGRTSTIRLLYVNEQGELSDLE
ncbi:MAG: hypothetical protein EB157_00020 [Euryarchaeota archaeon]|nr:hypothetical protein [Euryarchaeota archaeon]